MHIDFDFSDADIEGVRTNMKRYAAIGVDVQITELDVKCPKNH